MKSVCIIVTVLLIAFVSPAFASEDVASTKDKGASFEQKKEAFIKKLDERIARLQEERSCSQEATSSDDLKVCREKYKGERASNRSEKK